MNPSATSYTPSFAVPRRGRQEFPVGTATQPARPHRMTQSASLTGGAATTKAISPMVLPREAPSAPAPAAASMPTPVLAAFSGSGPTLTAADRLRLLHPKRQEGDAATQRTSPGASSAITSPAVHGAVGGASASVTPISSSPPLTHSQAPPAPRTTIRYTRSELLALENAAIDAVRRGPVADAPPFTRLPGSFVPLLSIPFALEFLNLDAASALMEGRPYSSPFIVTSSDSLPTSTATVAGRGGGGGHSSSRGALGLGEAASPSSLLTAEMTAEKLHCYHCPECSQGGPHPCDAIATVLYNARKYIMMQPLGRCLLQAPEVVWGQIQLALVFEAKQSSLRLRMLAEKFPAIPRKVGEYLFGEGYHLQLPSVTAHEEWRTAMQMLKFDAIRDNRTRVVTDLSKHWKKRHTQFEQFVAFFGYRDDVPTVEVRNILTRSVKPGMVAMLTGDVVALILLHHLGFFVPPDYYWSVFPFLGPALGEGTMTHDVIRHLACYFAAKQDPALYNPITDPFTTYTSS